MTLCPICQSNRATTLFSVSASEAAQHFVLREANAERHDALAGHIKALWGGSLCKVQKCLDCAFGFADPYVAGDFQFYSLAYERSGYPSHKWEFDRTLADLAQTRFTGQRVLEAGAGPGLFLDLIVDKYVPRSGVTALEFGDAAIAALRAKGYNARKEDICEAELAQGFDAIFLFQVLEHMDRVDTLFAAIRNLLAPHGFAYVAVPNTKRIAFNEANGSLLDMPPNHIGRWSVESFRRLSCKHGLRVEASELEPHSMIDFIKQDVTYIYLRRAQYQGTIANWSRARRSDSLGKFVGAAVALFGAPKRIPIWLNAAADKELGGSLWIKLALAHP